MATKLELLSQQRFDKGHQECVDWAYFVQCYHSEYCIHLKRQSGAENVNALIRYGEHCKLHTLYNATTATLGEYLAKLAQDKRSPRTVQTHKTRILAGLNWAARRWPDYSAPTIRLPRKKQSRDRKGRAITWEEYERIQAKVSSVRRKDGPAWRHYLEGMWLSGLRLEESLKLSWDDSADFAVEIIRERCYIRIREGADKSGEARTLPLAPEFSMFLMKTPEWERKGLVFKIGRSTDRISRTVSEIGKRAGVVVNKSTGKYASLHDFRRSFGDRLANRGVSPQHLQVFMRHDSFETTLRYYVKREAQEVSDLEWSRYELGIDMPERTRDKRYHNGYKPPAKREIPGHEVSTPDRRPLELSDDDREYINDYQWDEIFDGIKSGRFKLIDLEAEHPEDHVDDSHTPSMRDVVSRLSYYELQADDLDHVGAKSLRDNLLTGRMVFCKNPAEGMGVEPTTGYPAPHFQPLGGLRYQRASASSFLRVFRES